MNLEKRIMQFLAEYKNVITCNTVIINFMFVIPFC
jgi:hypothetical protein